MREILDYGADIEAMYVELPTGYEKFYPTDQLYEQRQRLNENMEKT
ncbi:MAG: hypothetical protein GY847_15310 [Proteobacteria bacterium]|nr:hypothetical protein [Pseudomonadota bacterium]